MNAVVSSHLNRVKFFKITLGAGAIFLLLAVVGMPVYNSQHEKLKFFYGEKDNLTEVVKQAEEPKIEKPKFYGMDSKNQPYTILADIGEQQDKSHLTLSQVYSDIKLEDNSFITMTSKNAQLSLDTNELDLEGNIKIKVDSGYTILTDKAKVHYKSRDAEGVDGVEVESSKGHITADTFKTLNSYDEIIFKNNVKTILYPSENNDKK
jgi:hypothetical protein